MLDQLRLLPRPDGLSREQVERALWRLNPAYAYRWLDGNDTFEWRGLDTGAAYLDASPPSATALVAAWQAVEAEQQEATQSAQAATDARTTAATDLASQYQAAITRLEAISTNGSTYSAAQVRDAMVDLARVQARLLKLVKAALT